MMTVIILQAVAVYNDFQNPLYFLPGTENATVQLTLLNFQSQFTTQYNLLFADHPAGHHPTADHVHLLQPQDRRGDGRGLGQGLTCTDCTDHQNSGGIVRLSQASSLAAMKSERASSPVNGSPNQASITAIRFRAASGEGWSTTCRPGGQKTFRQLGQGGEVRGQVLLAPEQSAMVGQRAAAGGQRCMHRRMLQQESVAAAVRLRQEVVAVQGELGSVGPHPSAPDLVRQAAHPGDQSGEVTDADQGSPGPRRTRPGSGRHHGRRQRPGSAGDASFTST